VDSINKSKKWGESLERAEKWMLLAKNERSC
jgi:hypothetical protein